MKYSKILLIFIITISCFVVGCTNTKKIGYTEISYSELQDKVSNKDTFTLFIGRETCSACSTFKQILNDKFTKQYPNATIYYIDLDKLTDEEKATFNSTYDYSATPTIAVITEGKFSNTDKVTGSDKYDDVINLMKKKGLIG